ncbi:MAG: flavin monoamine oxidase family protein, partial [Planctomycetales bacterium]
DRVGSHCFILNQPVKSIALDDKQATVTLADGRVLQGDDVILTAPVSTWGQIEFDPPLPAELKPQMGINTKFLTHVKTRFWEEDNQSPRSFSDGVIPLTWEDTGNQPEEGGVCLTVYGGGPTAKQASDWPDPDRQPNYLAALKALYPRIAANFLAGKFINWPQDRWALGSYSFPAPGQVTTLGPILYEGLGRLHFAGEHCCYAFIGYMEGALQSGGLLARRLAERDGLVKKK